MSETKDRVVIDDWLRASNWILTDHENSNSDLHMQLDKMEHELRSLEFNRPYEMEKIRELTKKVYELKTKLAESEIAF